MSAEYLSQGYPLVAGQMGRRYAVVGWRTAPSAAAPLLVPIDAPGGRPAAQAGAFVEGGEFVFSTPEPARELAAQVLGVLDEFAQTRVPEYGSDAHDLAATLRALLASWST